MATTDTPPNQEAIEVDTPFDLRPVLGDIGIIEVERGICEDTFENRRIIREAKLQYIPVYTKTGVPNGLIQVVSKDTAAMNRLTSLKQRTPILVDPKDFNSDYLTGLDLLAEEAGDVLAPPWVIGATKMWRREQDEPIATDKRLPTALPHRCNHIKTDGIRCMWWSSGRTKDNGLCRIHLAYVARKTIQSVETARARLIQAAPHAVETLEELMTTAVSEPVRLKAATEILDRAGVRGGVELDVSVTDQNARPAKDVIAERLDTIAKAEELRKQRMREAAEAEEQAAIEDADVIETPVHIIQEI